jgi:transcription elongation factor GreA
VYVLNTIFWGILNARGSENFLAVEKEFPMTQAGKEKLENELDYLKSVKRKEVVERIKTARSFGDLSENSEYDSAKEEQAFVEGRITTLENMIRNAKIIEESEMTSESVTLGRSVTFIELPDGAEETYIIVGSAEADPFEGKISNDSPIAKSLLGKKVGDKISVQTPGGEMSVRIVTIK